jgi:UDP-N-acetylglucosamine 2-epimerase (non-hydrolysing)
VKIISVVGARPNFMKIAPLHKALNQFNIQHPAASIQHLICHTGQHYDQQMSKVFFEDLELAETDFYLGVGSGSHAEQTAKIIVEFEKILLQEKPDLIIVVGDVNSTIACSLAAVKMGIKIAHVEAGLRSFDRTMPEEINRVLTDSISDYLFVTEQSGLDNLKREGISESKIFFVGNVMIDSMINYLPKIDKSKILNKLLLKKCEYVVVTLHRPSNVDYIDCLIKIVDLLNILSEKIKIIFPVHPRTKNMLSQFELENKLSKNIILTDPLGYLDFIALLRSSIMVLTDSGGIQEETTFLNIPCVTLRTSTERPVTVDKGTNYLVGDNFEKIKSICFEILNGNNKKGTIPDLWDGRSSERIVRILMESFSASS